MPRSVWHAGRYDVENFCWRHRLRLVRSELRRRARCRGGRRRLFGDGYRRASDQAVLLAQP